MFMKRELQIFRDGHLLKNYLAVPLLPGEQGNFQTLAAAAEIVREDRLEPDLRRFVLREIVGRQVRGHDFTGEVERIFRFCQSEIVYRKDPFGVERVADIWSTLYALGADGPEGDCGIKSTFFASCCAILGHKPFFVLIKQRQDQRAFSHVYNAVLIEGRFRFYDATPQDAPAGWEVKSAVKLLYQIL